MPVNAAVQRCSIGGKLLTNQLKEVISYRQLQVLEETYVINQCKEDVCFVSTEFDAHMALVQKSNNSLACKYLLPDFVDNHRGQVLPMTEVTDANAQCIRMAVERFSIPELLLTPSDIGLDECGVVQCAVNATRLAANACEQCSEQAGHVQARLLNNVLLTGGSSLFPGFSERFENDLRSLVPDVMDINVLQTDSAITHAWHGAKLRTLDDSFASSVVMRHEYLENGPAICRKRFKQPVN